MKVDFDREFKYMSKDDMEFLLGKYNNHILELIYGTMGIDSNVMEQSVSVYDFYENEYQDILKEED